MNTLDNSAHNFGTVCTKRFVGRILVTPIDLKEGLLGYVRSVDGDGDVMAYFLDAFKFKAGEHWIETSRRRGCLQKSLGT